MAKQWLKGSSSGETFYAIAGGEEVTYSLLGNGTDVATPKEIHEALLEDKQVARNTRDSIVYEYKKDKTNLNKSLLPKGAYVYEETEEKFGEYSESDNSLSSAVPISGKLLRTE